MYLGYGMDYYYLVLVLPTVIFALIAQAKVKSAYKKYSKVLNSRGITGAQAAQAVLNYYGISDVRIVPIGGKLSDNFNPSTKVISLSQGVFNNSTVAAIGIVCHEAGHAAQHAEGYSPIKIRNSLLPICNIGSRFGIPLAIIGLILPTQFLFVSYIGIALYAFAFIFHLITLPVELNASKRALSVIEETGLLYNEEINGARKVLTAAAMTYVAAMITSLANLLRILLIVNNRKHD